MKVQIRFVNGDVRTFEEVSTIQMVDGNKTTNYQSNAVDGPSTSEVLKQIGFLSEIERLRQNWRVGP